MDHGGEAARPTAAAAAGSTDLGMALAAGAVQGTEAANIGSGAVGGQLGAPAGSSFTDFDLSGAHHNSTGFAPHVSGEAPVAAGSHLRRQPGPRAAYPNNGEFWRQQGPVQVVVLAGPQPQLPGGVVPVQGSYGYYSALQPRPEAGRGVVLVDPLSGGGGGGGAVYSGDYALQPSPGAGRGGVPVNLLPGDAAHDEAFVGQLPGGGGGVVAYDDYIYYALPRPGARRGEVPVDLLPENAGHGEAFVGQLPGGGGGGVTYDDYIYYALPRPGAGRGEVLVDLLRHGAGHGEVFVGQVPAGGEAAYDYYALQPRPGAGHDEVPVDLLPEYAGHGVVFVGQLAGGGGAAVHGDYGYYPWQPRPGDARGDVLPGGVGVVFDDSGNFARQTLLAPGTGGADRFAGAFRGRNLGAGYGARSGALADDLGAGYDNRGIAAEHLHRLVGFVGIGACSVAVNGVAAGPGSPVVAFQLFALVLCSLLLVILHVLRV